MKNNFTAVSPSLTISQLIDTYMIGTDQHVFPVVHDGTFAGLVCLEDIQTVPREEWDTKLVKEIMTPYKELDTSRPSDTVSDALGKITKSDVGQVPVVKDNNLLGMLSRRDILLWLTLKSKDNELDDV